MRKKFGLIAALIIGTTTSLQVSACTDDSKYQEFISDVNSGHAFFGILGAANNPLSKQIIDALHTMQITNNNVPSKWDNWLTEKKIEINSVTTNGTIDIKIYEKSPYGKDSSDIVNQFWNDKKISWQQQIYHWLLDHKISDNSSAPVADSGVKEIQNPVDKERAFKALPIVFIVNKGKLITVGQEWGTIDNHIDNPNQFFDQLTALITGNLLKTAAKKTI
ncbi:hypothetical protein [Spiroplasma endosymbiont of Aleiodes alternator]|uniref:hypothetical protein n=1 Tax=Spiroplasma endosymbiont of Aleiodes alternator TaxID=3139329 RepID=UPI003CCB1D38